MRINAKNIRRLISIKNKESFFILILILLLQSTTVTANISSGRSVPGGGWSDESKITIVKQELVSISHVNDIYLGSYGSISSDKVGSDDVCVFSSTGSYSVTVSSKNGAFALQSSDTTTDIPYSIDWTTTSTVPVTYNTRTNVHTADRWTTNCKGNGGSSTNATFDVTINSQNFNAAEPGSYQDTLTLLVRPE